MWFALWKVALCHLLFGNKTHCSTTQLIIHCSFSLLFTQSAVVNLFIFTIHSYDYFFFLFFVFFPFFSCMMFNLNSKPQSRRRVTTVLSCWLSQCWQPRDSWQMYRWWMFSPLCKDDGIKVQTNRVIDGKSRAMLIRPGPHSVMYGKASCGQFVSEKWGVLCREGHKKKEGKKRSENKEIIIRGGGRKYPKLVFIVAALARCYGNKQISFQGRAWGSLPPVCALHAVRVPRRCLGMGMLPFCLLLPVAPLVYP